MATHSARSHAYRTLARAVRREEHTCWLCGHPIDLALPYRDPHTGKVNTASWSLDHVIPIAAGGPPTDRTNCRAAHYGCNSQRNGSGLHRTNTTTTPLTTSRDW
jgi:5-methylcytosine-specific restriction endonuclease McrA